MTIGLLSGLILYSADKMINDMEWLDDRNILIATGDGLRIFNINEERYVEKTFNIRTKKKSLGEVLNLMTDTGLENLKLLIKIILVFCKKWYNI